MKIGIKILGCPKNVADCEVLAAVLKKRGHEIVRSAEEADLVLIDTCTFIEDAKRETIDTILDFVYYKKSRRDLKIAVKGCMVQRYYEELKREIPEVDLWIGVLPPFEIAKAIENLSDSVKDPDPVYEESDHEDLEGKPYAYVKIADGCDRKCTFCAIPLFKGRYRSRSVQSIVTEVEKLVRSGKKEIILVSQDSTAYGTDIYGKQHLPDLLREVSRIDGDFWIRVMYLHPDYLTDEIINAIASTEKVVPYFEVPVQHGSDKILRRMGRIKKRKELEALFEKIRSLSKDATIRTTVMVGFPGESEEDFQELLDFLSVAHPDRMGVFVYSDEEGTVASGYEDKVEKEIAQEREEIVASIIPDLLSSSNERWVGRTVRAIVERDEGMLVARSFMDAPEIDGYIEVKGEAKEGEFVEVQITEAYDYYMEGRLIG
jgi:ribosomal protein S12 methylthiotransferase